jgi:3-oxoacyl-[acyl-carrier protein] reductase
MMETRPLLGKAALVTGGSRGIGAGIAIAFAEAGAKVAITYNASPDGAEATVRAAHEKGAEAFAIRADAGDAAQVEAAVHGAFERLGGHLDILVNNAGVFRRKLLHEATDEDFDAVMNPNVRGVFAASRTAAALMKPGSRIINVGSSFGSRVPAPGIGLYAISKFAVAGMTRAFARDLAPKGISVNCIEPGPIKTDMNRGDERHARIMAMMTAFGRYGEVGDVANMAVFLALPASGYITGATFAVDGGFEA